MTIRASHAVNAVYGHYLAHRSIPEITEERAAGCRTGRRLPLDLQGLRWGRRASSGRSAGPVETACPTRFAGSTTFGRPGGSIVSTSVGAQIHRRPQVSQAVPVPFIWHPMDRRNIVNRASARTPHPSGDGAPNQLQGSRPGPQSGIMHQRETIPAGKITTLSQL